MLWHQLEGKLWLMLTIYATECFLNLLNASVAVRSDIYLRLEVSAFKGFISDHSQRILAVFIWTANSQAKIEWVSDMLTNKHEWISDVVPGTLETMDLNQNDQGMCCLMKAVDYGCEEYVSDIYLYMGREYVRQNMWDMQGISFSWHRKDGNKRKMVLLDWSMKVIV